MKNAAVICNVLLWVFFCMVLVTDGFPRGSEIPLGLFTFLMPIFNVLLVRILASPSRAVRVVAIASNLLWLGIIGWLMLERLPSHPEEGGLLAYVLLMVLTPTVSAVAIYVGLRAPKPLLAK